MYASVIVQAGISQRALTVHDSAILDTGTRRLVIVDRGAGVFEPRAVITGARGGGRTEILQGLNDHESVVVNGNFLIDAESNLKAVIDGMVHDAGMSAEKRP
jgi:Cu(I)/Ag(I) efflux system membrane fusion protein